MLFQRNSAAGRRTLNGRQTENENKFQITTEWNDRTLRKNRLVFISFFCFRTRMRSKSGACISVLTRRQWMGKLMKEKRCWKIEWNEKPREKKLRWEYIFIKESLCETKWRMKRVRGAHKTRSFHHFHRSCIVDVVGAALAAGYAATHLVSSHLFVVWRSRDRPTQMKTIKSRFDTHKCRKSEPATERERERKNAIKTERVQTNTENKNENNIYSAIRRTNSGQSLGGRCNIDTPAIARVSFSHSPEIFHIFFSPFLTLLSFSFFLPLGEWNFKLLHRKNKIDEKKVCILLVRELAQVTSKWQSWTVCMWKKVINRGWRDRTGPERGCRTRRRSEWEWEVNSKSRLIAPQGWFGTRECKSFMRISICFCGLHSVAASRCVTVVLVDDVVVVIVVH